MKKILVKGNSISPYDFMEFIMKEMDWNDPRIYEICKLSEDTTELYDCLNLTNDQWSVAFSYDCLPGSSVKPELKEAILKFSNAGYDVKIKRGWQTGRRESRHDYYIIFK
jgi:hypothetical protein